MLLITHVMLTLLISVPQGDWLLVRHFSFLSDSGKQSLLNFRDRPWDICAGSIIAQEAGGMCAGSHTSPLDNDVNEETLTGRKYIVIRSIGDSAVCNSTACNNRGLIFSIADGERSRRTEASHQRVLRYCR